jgi:hypothetical protein
MAGRARKRAADSPTHNDTTRYRGLGDMVAVGESAAAELGARHGAVLYGGK